MNIARKSPLPIALALVLSTGCVEIDGGAVEVSWSLRTVAGDPLGDDCQYQDDTSPVATIRLLWRPYDGTNLPVDLIPRNSDERRSFPCRDSRGVTGFEIPPGEHAFWVEPRCDNGRRPRAIDYEVPPPIVRDVRTGLVITLDAMLITLDDCEGVEE